MNGGLDLMMMTPGEEEKDQPPAASVNRHFFFIQRADDDDYDAADYHDNFPRLPIFFLTFKFVCFL